MSLSFSPINFTTNKCQSSLTSLVIYSLAAHLPLGRCVLFCFLNEAHVFSRTHLEETQAKRERVKHTNTLKPGVSFCVSCLHSNLFFPTISPFHFKAIYLSIPNTLGVSPSTWIHLAMVGIRADPGTSLPLPLRKIQWPPQFRPGSQSLWTDLKSPISNHSRRKLVTEQTAAWPDNYQHKYYSESIWKGLAVSTLKSPPDAILGENVLLIGSKFMSSQCS